MKTRILTFTDCVDIASNELRATLIQCINRLGAENDIAVEPFVFCKEFSLINCAFMIRLMAESCDPENTVFLIIANALPTARSTRARIVGRTKNGIRFVAENTGTLSWLLDDFGLKEVYEYSSRGLDGATFVSFGGKYFHAPEAVKVASTTNLDNYGPEFDPAKLARVDIVDGTIVHIDNFGVAKIKTFLPADLSEGDRIQIAINGREWNTVIFSHSMKNLPDGTWAIYNGSSIGLMEVGCVRRIMDESDDYCIGNTIDIRRS